MPRTTLAAFVTAASALVLQACQGQNPVLLGVIAPDGGDPFYGSDAATQVRVLVEDDATPPQLINVGANGEFQLPIQPANLTVRARVRTGLWGCTRVSPQSAR